MHHTWLFRFTSYSYSQGTRDAYRGDMRLVTFTLPCDEVEARYNLQKQLLKEKLEIDAKSIQNVSIRITNS